MSLLGKFLNFFKHLRKPFEIGQTRNIGLNCMGESTEATGLVLGVYNEDADPYGEQKTFTKTAKNIDKMSEGKLTELLRISGPVPKRGETRIFYGLVKKFSAVAVVGIGDSCQTFNEVEQIDEVKEGIRMAVGTGVRALQENHVRTMYVESFGHAESSAEGAALGIWVYQDLKDRSKHVIVPRLELYDDCDYTGWQIGLQKAAAQNLARQFSETPANLLTPVSFSQSAVEILSKAGVNVEVKVRNWASMMDMQGFLAASKGSCEPPIFLEISYYGCDTDIPPIVMIGKGVTFNSGGLCLKSCTDMEYMKGDIAGAASIVAVCRAVSALQLPLNIRGLLPLHENLPGTCAVKPGDIIKMKNGKTVLVDDTDFADVGNHCPEMSDLMGPTATGVFSNNEQLYEMMRIASIHTGDRIWKMPLWRHFSDKVKSSAISDVQDPRRPTGAPCVCASFFKEFAPPVDWIHLETYGVHMSDGVTWPYLRKGLSGRPTRTIIEFLAQLACKEVDEEKKAARTS